MTREGKRTFYEATDGFVTLTGIPYDTLPCKDCHASTLADGTAVDAATYQPSCADCHADPNNPTSNIEDSVCLGCHSRQGAEQKLFSDVHRTAGMRCVDCHSAHEMHGDGTEYVSFLAAGAMNTECENCHVEEQNANAPSVDPASHDLHAGKLHCTACHVESVTTCYNCHFETQVAGAGKRFFGQGPRTGFRMIMNYEGQVHTATFQALVHEGQSFVTITPFVAHITRQASQCGDCHGNTHVEQYNTSGQINVTTWDDTAEGAARLVGPTGVIPVPPDWKTAMKFAFLNYTGDATIAPPGATASDDAKAHELALWQFLENEPDGGHIVYGEPLTQEQMNDLINN
jgi:hypothetical protein